MRTIQTIKSTTINNNPLYIVKIVNPRNVRYAVSTKENVRLTKNTPETRIVRGLDKAHQVFNKVKIILASTNNFAFRN